MNKILVEVSVGELLDKLSILEIKKIRIENEKRLCEKNSKDPSKLNFINEEYDILKNQFEKNVKIDDKLNKFDLFKELKDINNKLWDRYRK